VRVRAARRYREQDTQTVRQGIDASQQENSHHALPLQPLTQSENAASHSSQHGAAVAVVAWAVKHRNAIAKNQTSENALRRSLYV
jgi:4-hydroxyphenylpyruvate dioxygenase-like putative hemolysin